jgi:hypothetical protein
MMQSTNNCNNLPGNNANFYYQNQPRTLGFIQPIYNNQGGVVQSINELGLTIMQPWAQGIIPMMTPASLQQSNNIKDEEIGKLRDEIVNLKFKYEHELLEKETKIEEQRKRLEKQEQIIKIQQQELEKYKNQSRFSNSSQSYSNGSVHSNSSSSTNSQPIYPSVRQKITNQSHKQTLSLLNGYRTQISDQIAKYKQIKCKTTFSLLIEIKQKLSCLLFLVKGAENTNIHLSNFTQNFETNLINKQFRLLRSQIDDLINSIEKVVPNGNLYKEFYLIFNKVSLTRSRLIGREDIVSSEYRSLSLNFYNFFDSFRKCVQEKNIFNQTNFIKKFLN